MTRNEAKTFILTMLEFYPSFPTTERTTDAWLGCFEKEDVKTLLAALKSHALSCKWPPTVAELVSIIEQSRRPAGSDWTAAEALSYVQNLAARYRQMSEEDKQQERMLCPKLTKDALRLIGFHRFLPYEPQPYNPWVTPPAPQQDPSGLFVKIYEQLKNREIDTRRLERLSSNEQKMLSGVNEATGGKLNHLLN